MKLAELPLDVLLSIIQFIGSSDIIHLGKTSRFFHELCDERVVWTCAYNNMRQENAVFPASSSLNDYSLAQIRQDTTAPARFVSLLKKHQCKTKNGEIMPLQPHSRCLITPTEAGDRFNTVVLISGGRVVVTGSSQFLSLWDIDKGIPRLVYSWEFTVYHIIGVCLSEQGYLRVVSVSPTVTIDRQMELRIFDFDYSSSTPKATYTLNWELEGTTGIYFPMHTLSGDYFLYIYQGTLFIWNFVLDTWSSWIIIDADYEELFFEIRSNLLIFISRSWVSGWRPHLQIGVSRQQAKAEPRDMIPDFVFDIPNLPTGVNQPNYEGDRMWNREAIWYESTNFSRMFDIATMAEGEHNYTYSTYEIHLPGANGNGGQVEFIREETLPLRCTASNDTSVNAYRISKGRLFKIWSNTGTVQIAFRDDARTPTNRLEEDPCIQVDLHMPDVSLEDVLGIGAFSFDPVSGQLCHIVNDGDAIAVLNYLPS